MRKVKFPLVFGGESGVTVIYPDDISKFSDTNLIDGFVVGMYSGDDNSIPDAPIEQTEKPVLNLDITFSGLTAKTKGGKARVGQPVTIDVKIKDQSGNVIPLSDDFAVPIIGRTGAIELVKELVFTNGQASTSISMATSGYYYIKSDAVNELSEDVKFSFKDFVIVIYE